MIVTINQAVTSCSQSSTYKSWLSPQAVIQSLSTSLLTLKTNDLGQYLNYADLVLRIKGAVNSIATAINASLSERTYLSACIDIICGRIKTFSNGNYAARITAKDIKKYVGLSQSACSLARKALQTKGVIKVDGDFVDISHFVSGVSDVLEKREDAQVAKIEEGVSNSGTHHYNVNVFNKNNNNNNVNPYQKKQPSPKKAKGAGDLFSKSEILSIVKNSPKLTNAIEEHFGKKLDAILEEDIRDGMPAIAHCLLTDGSGFSYRQAWEIAYRTHGINAFWFLVLALGSKVTSAGRWFFSMTRNKNFDLQAAIEAMRVAKANEEALAKASEKTRCEVAKREKIRQSQTENCKKFIAAWSATVGNEAKKLAEEYDLVLSVESYLYLTVANGKYVFSHTNMEKGLVEKVFNLIEKTCETLNVVNYTFISGVQCGIGVKSLEKYL